jgi:SAM-dependent methyltransferase
MRKSDEQLDLYSRIAQAYWNNEYTINDTRHVVHNAGSDLKTILLAEREIDLFLFPTEEKCLSLLSDKKLNPFPTFCESFSEHPPVDTKFDAVLDYGCGGFARYSIVLSKYFKKVYGVDISSEAIKLGKARLRDKKIKNVILMCNNGIKIPIGDNSVNFIFSNLVLQHIGNLEVLKLLAYEFCRVLKPGGMVRLEYLDGSSRKNDYHQSPVEGNGISKEELEKIYDEVGMKTVCVTEDKGCTWITARK